MNWWTIAKTLAVGAYELFHEVRREQRKDAAAAAREHVTPLTYRDEHQRAQAQSAARPWHPREPIRPPRPN